MSEEVRQIDELEKRQQKSNAAQLEELTGEQVFIRSCNTCHPKGQAGIGPSLERVNEQFSSDDELKEFIRKGKGMMPPQPNESLSEAELANLIDFLRVLKPR